GGAPVATIARCRGRSVPCGEPAAAQAAGDRVEERRIERNDDPDRRAAPAHLPIAGSKARSAGLVLRLPAAARARLHQPGGAAEGAAAPAREDRSLSTSGAA